MSVGVSTCVYVCVFRWELKCLSFVPEEYDPRFFFLNKPNVQIHQLDSSVPDSRVIKGRNGLVKFLLKYDLSLLVFETEIVEAI